MPIDLQTLREISSRKKVAEILQIDYPKLIKFTITSKADERYYQFDVKKKLGGVRTISAPASGLKFAQTKLNSALQEIFKPKSSTHGFVTDRGILSNAKKHVGKKHVLNIDLKDFFPSINFGRVRGMFMGKPYELNSELATIFAQICCFENGLPQGAPTSPVVSNMVCAPMDSQLQKLAQKHGCTYSRYADDITFSCTKRAFPEDLASLQEGKTIIGRELEQAIHSNGFTNNTNKIRLQSAKQRQEVTGLTVNKFPNVSRKYIRQLRAMVHAWERYGAEAAQKEFYEKYDTKHRPVHKMKPSFAEIVRGKLEFLKQIRGKNDTLCQALENRIIILLGDTIPETLTTRQLAEKTVWILESEEAACQGTAFYLKDVGFVTCHHVLQPGMYAFKPDNYRQRYPIKIIKSNATVDLAVLEIDAPTEYQLEKTTISQLEPDDSIVVVGYPNFGIGDSIYIEKGAVTATRVRSGIRRLIVSARIVAGTSGGPVLDQNNYVVGVAVTGADNIANSEYTDNHGVIPISALDFLDAYPVSSPI